MSPSIIDCYMTTTSTETGPADLPLSTTGRVQSPLHPGGQSLKLSRNNNISLDLLFPKISARVTKHTKTLLSGTISSMACIHKREGVRLVWFYSWSFFGNIRYPGWVFSSDTYLCVFIENYKIVKATKDE